MLEFRCKDYVCVRNQKMILNLLYVCSTIAIENYITDDS